MLRSSARLTAASPVTTSRGPRWTSVVLLLVAVAALVALGRGAADWIPAFSAWVDRLGIWGPVAFVAGYAIACVLFIPATLLTLAAGAIFGLWQGIALVLAGATLGAVASFMIARYLARDAVKQRLSRHPRLAAIDRTVGADGRRIVLLMRLSPVFPFGALNYGLGVTQLRFADFLMAMIGIVPGTTLYVYSGTVASAVASAAGSSAPERGLAHHAVLALGLLATLAVTVLITRAARRALADAGVAASSVVAGALPGKNAPNPPSETGV